MGKKHEEKGALVGQVEVKAMQDVDAIEKENRKEAVKKAEKDAKKKSKKVDKKGKKKDKEKDSKEESVIEPIKDKKQVDPLIARPYKKIDIDAYRAKEGEKIDLTKYATTCDVKIDKDKTKTEYMLGLQARLQDLQERLYAENEYGLIVVLQGMDAAGKDGTVKHVFSSMNPAGINVSSFKQPSVEEKDHDYLWRINKNLPGRGEIGIFNRSQYEDVLVTRVHDLVDKGNLPKKLVKKDIWQERYEQINNWETYLNQNGFPMVKIFLHLSKEEQRKRLVERIIEKEKNWKFSVSDVNERQYWNEYQHCYEDLLANTSTELSPWYIVPADNKWYTRYVVANIVYQALKKINPKMPKLSKDMEERLKMFKKLIMEHSDETLMQIEKQIEQESSASK